MNTYVHQSMLLPKRQPDNIYYPSYALGDFDIEIDYGNKIYKMDGYDYPSSDFPARETDEDELKEIVDEILNMNIKIDNHIKD